MDIKYERALLEIKQKLDGSIKLRISYNAVYMYLNINRYDRYNSPY